MTALVGRVAAPRPGLKVDFGPEMVVRFTAAEKDDRNVSAVCAN